MRSASWPVPPDNLRSKRCNIGWTSLSTLLRFGAMKMSSRCSDPSCLSSGFFRLCLSLHPTWTHDRLIKLPFRLAVDLFQTKTRGYRPDRKPRKVDEASLYVERRRGTAAPVEAGAGVLRPGRGFRDPIWRHYPHSSGQRIDFHVHARF